MALAMLNSDIFSVDSGKTPFHQNRKLSDAYIHFFHLANGRGERMLFGSAEDFLPDGSLRGHWIPHGSEWVRVAEREPLDLIFDKLGGNDPLFLGSIERAIELGIGIFGHYGLNRFVSDKWACYQAFSEHLALTRLMDSDPATIEDQIDEFFERMDRHYAHHDNVAVLKPRSGWESRGLYILVREPGGVRVHWLSGQQITDVGQLRHMLDSVARTPYILQAWVNTSRGIPEINLHTERHDARFVFRIREPGTAQFVQSYVKTPQGMLYIPVESFPRPTFELLELVAGAIARQFPYGIFCVDLMRDISGDWYITELNDQVGFNIDFSSEQDVRGVTELMECYLHEIHTMRHNRHLPRYRSAR